MNTERLFLRHFTINDAEFLFSLLNSPGWIDFIGDRNIQTIDDAKNYILNKFMPSYEKNGYGPFIIILKNEKIPVGLCSLVKRDYLEDIDIGYAILPEHCKNGYAYEATLATIKFVKEELKISKLVAVTEIRNLNSNNLLLKLGFTFEGLKDTPENETLNFYSI